jgi:hypothetical protein
VARPQVADRGTASNRAVAANTLNKQSRTADKGCFSSLEGEVLKDPHSKTGHVANNSQTQDSA